MQSSIPFTEPKSGGSDTKIATTMAPKYNDLNVVAGSTYYYVVNSCDGVNLSAYSTEISAKAH